VVFLVHCPHCRALATLALLTASPLVRTPSSPRVRTPSSPRVRTPSGNLNRGHKVCPLFPEKSLNVILSEEKVSLFIEKFRFSVSSGHVHSYDHQRRFQ